MSHKCEKFDSFCNEGEKLFVFCFYHATGLITGPALKTFRPRVVAAIGSALSGLGLILSSLSNQLWQIIIAYGLVGK